MSLSRNMLIYGKNLFFIIILVGFSFISGCSGGGGSGSSDTGGGAPAASILSGVAAVGTAIVNGNISVICATGEPLSALTDNTGAWQVTLSGQTLPCAVEVSNGTINGAANSTSYTSIALATGTVNVTPFTDLIVANLVQTQNTGSWFTGLKSSAAALTHIIQGQVNAACEKLYNALPAIPLSANNPITAPFSPNAGQVGDDMLTALQQAMNTTGVTYASLLSDASAPAFAAPPAGFATALATAYANTASGGGGASKNIVAEHALAQTGLAIALASTVLQSQVQVLLTAVSGSVSCQALTGGGSAQGDPTSNTVTVYYDTACTNPYIIASPVVTPTKQSGGAKIGVVETATYFGLTGATIGTMAINETAIFSTTTNGLGTIQLYGTGAFTPATGAKTPVQLGLYCTIPPITSGITSLTFPCGGGIAQDFPALNLAIGAVTPLTVTVDSSNGEPANVNFTGGGSTVTGPLGSLTLSNPSPNSLIINGGSPFTATTASGGAAEFALFPPTPTSWNLTDPTHDEQLEISVVSDNSRDSTMTITQSVSGSSLAAAALDQSGSGTIKYSDSTTAFVTSWTLAD